MGATEIYSCKPGQKLKEGRLDYSHDITSKEQAEGDAKRRVQLDPTLAKVAYYTVSDDGRFRMIHSYTNPRPLAAKPAARPAAPAGRSVPAAVKTKSKPKPRGLWRRLLASLGLGG